MKVLNKVQGTNNQESSAVKDGNTHETDVDINNTTDNSIIQIPPPLTKPF